MNRAEMLKSLTDSSTRWDILIIGGGATGLGCAVDAAARGYRTLLVEQSDFAKATSSRSTKLIHGGVRYLQQGNLKLVRESLRERGLLIRNAPHLVKRLGFIVPNYRWWEGAFYGTGLKIYDRLAGDLGLGRSRRLSCAEALQHAPTLEPDGLRGGVLYYDAQFDDARLAISLAQTAADAGAVVANYAQVTSLVKRTDQICGAMVRDLETNQEHELAALAVINATGVFTDSIRHLDEPESNKLIVPSQGAHVVLEKSFLPGDTAIMVPKTADGRVLFAIPWHDRVLIGTTDTPVSQPQLEPRPLRGEIEFLLAHAGRYLTKDPQLGDVLCTFAGLRPLVKTAHTKNTALVPRDHTVMVSKSGLITVTGGKWTTYRKMAEDTVDQASLVAGLKRRPSTTATLRLRGWREADEQERKDNLWPPNHYGSDASALQQMVQEEPALNEPLHPALPYRAAEVVWAVRHEMACTVEDVLARRTRALFLDTRASVEAAPKVARLMTQALRRDQQWEQQQVMGYRELARAYLPI
jgi:glycerol-3-phosphate dehydrogenase